jgi:hypothetical protein
MIRQLTVAASDGTTAALDAIDYLNKYDQKWSFFILQKFRYMLKRRKYVNKLSYFLEKTCNYFYFVR